MEKTWQERLYDEIFHPNDKIDTYPVGLNEAVEAVLQTLPPRGEEIIRLHFGADGQRLSLAKIGNKLNMSGQNARAIEQKALSRLRHPLRAKRLKLGEPAYQKMLEEQACEQAREKAYEDHLLGLSASDNPQIKQKALEELSERSQELHLDKLGLRTRFYRFLRPTFRTVGEIYEAGPGKVLQIRNVSQCTVREVAQKLNELHVILPGDTWEKYLADNDDASEA